MRARKLAVADEVGFAMVGVKHLDRRQSIVREVRNDVVAFQNARVRQRSDSAGGRDAGDDVGGRTARPFDERRTPFREISIESVSDAPGVPGLDEGRRHERPARRSPGVGTFREDRGGVDPDAEALESIRDGHDAAAPLGTLLAQEREESG